MFETAKLQDFSEHVQRYRDEIAAGLHVLFKVAAALREKNCMCKRALTITLLPLIVIIIPSVVIYASRSAL